MQINLFNPTTINDFIFAQFPKTFDTLKDELKVDLRNMVTEVAQREI